MNTRTCTGCQRALPLEQFSTTLCRGTPLVRSRCRDCMRAYYASARVKLARMKARGVKCRFVVVPIGAAWEVRRLTADSRGTRSKVLSTYPSEQEAETAVAELQGEGVLK